MMFTKLWEWLDDWVASKGGYSHTVAIIFAGAVTAYAAVPAFAQLVNSVYAQTPAWFHQIALALVGLFAWYKNTQSE
jgi:hypothetical protein